MVRVRVRFRERIRSSVRMRVGERIVEIEKIREKRETSLVQEVDLDLQRLEEGWLSICLSLSPALTLTLTLTIVGRDLPVVQDLTRVTEALVTEVTVERK
jgi:hypothetical protein